MHNPMLGIGLRSPNYSSPAESVHTSSARSLLVMPGLGGQTWAMTFPISAQASNSSLAMALVKYEKSLSQKNPCCPIVTNSLKSFDLS